MRPGHTSEVRAFDTLLRLFSKSDSWSGENREDQASNLFSELILMKKVKGSLLVKQKQKFKN